MVGGRSGRASPRPSPPRSGGDPKGGRPGSRPRRRFEPSDASTGMIASRACRSSRYRPLDHGPITNFRNTSDVGFESLGVARARRSGISASGVRLKPVHRLGRPGLPSGRAGTAPSSPKGRRPGIAAAAVRVRGDADSARPGPRSETRATLRRAAYASPTPNRPRTVVATAIGASPPGLPIGRVPAGRLRHERPTSSQGVARSPHRPRTTAGFLAASTMLGPRRPSSGTGPVEPDAPTRGLPDAGHEVGPAGATRASPESRPCLRLSGDRPAGLDPPSASPGRDRSRLRIAVPGEIRPSKGPRTLVGIADPRRAGPASWREE